MGGANSEAQVEERKGNWPADVIITYRSNLSVDQLKMWRRRGASTCCEVDWTATNDFQTRVPPGHAPYATASASASSSWKSALIKDMNPISSDVKTICCCTSLKRPVVSTSVQI